MSDILILGISTPREGRDLEQELDFLQAEARAGRTLVKVIILNEAERILLLPIGDRGTIYSFLERFDELMPSMFQEHKAQAYALLSPVVRDIGDHNATTLEELPLDDQENGVLILGVEKRVEDYRYLALFARFLDFPTSRQVSAFQEMPNLRESGTLGIVEW